MYAILCKTGVRIFEEFLTGFKIKVQRRKDARAQGGKKGIEAQRRKGATAQGGVTIKPGGQNLD